MKKIETNVTIVRPDSEEISFHMEVPECRMGTFFEALRHMTRNPSILWGDFEFNGEKFNITDVGHKDLAPGNYKFFQD